MSQKLFLIKNTRKQIIWRPLISHHHCKYTKQELYWNQISGRKIHEQESVRELIQALNPAPGCRIASCERVRGRLVPIVAGVYVCTWGVFT